MNPTQLFKLASILTVSIGLCPTASSDEAPATFKVSKARQQIRVDGKLDDDWNRTEVATFDFYRRDESASDRQVTRFRMLWDSENLYVFFQCEDAFITARETKRDGQPYFDDCAEIFLIPAPARLDMHYGFELNLNRASNDFIFLTHFYQGKHVLIKSYDPEFSVAVTVDGTLNNNADTDRGWTMELAIPLMLFEGIDHLSPVAPGNRWAFQAIRQDRNDSSGNRRSWSTLFEVAPQHDGVHEPEDFGFLEFVE